MRAAEDKRKLEKRENKRIFKIVIEFPLISFKIQLKPRAAF